MAGSSLGNLVARLALDIAEFVTPLDRASQQAKRFERDIKNTFNDAAKSLLSLAAAVVSVQSVMSAFTKGLNYADQLEKLKDSTGANVEELDKLAIAAKLNGVEIDQLGKAFGQMSKFMVAAEDGTSKQADVLKALGVTAVKAGDDMTAKFGEVAKAFKDFEDGPTKTAAAMAIFGKQGQEFLQFLKNYERDMRLAKEITEAWGAIMPEQAAASDAFKDNLDIIGMSAERAALQMLKGLGPAIENVKNAFLAAGPQMNSFFEILGKGIGWIVEWGAKGLIGLTTTVQLVTAALGAAAAIVGAILSGDFAQVKTIIAEAQGDAQKILNTSAAALDAINTPLKTMADVAPKATKSSDDLRKALAGLGDQSRKAADDMKKLIEEAELATEAEKMELDPKTLKTWYEWQKILEKNPKLQTLFNEALDIMIAKDPVRQKMARDAIKAQEDLHTAQMASFKDWFAMIDAEEKANIDRAAKLQDYVQGLKDEQAAIGKTKLDVALMTNERKREAELLGITDESVKQLINSRYDEAAAIIRTTDAMNKYQDEQKKTAGLFQEIADAGVDAFVDILHGGRDAMKRLADSIKSMLLKAFAEIVARPLIIQVLGAFGGMIGLPGAANAASQLLGGAGGGAGGISSILNLFGGGGGGSGILGSLGSMISGIGGNFFGGLGGGIANMGIEGIIAGTFGNISAGMTAMGAGNILGALGSFASAAIPVVGALLAIASIAGVFDSGGGPKKGGFARAGAGIAVNPEDRFFTPNDSDVMVQGIVDGISDSYDTAFKQFGGLGKPLADFFLGFDTDPEGTAPNRIHSEAWMNGQMIYRQDLRDLGRDPEALQTALETESQRMLLAALQNSDLPAAVTAMLNTAVAETATPEEVQTAILGATAIKTILDVLAEDPLEAVAEAFANQVDGATGAFFRMGDSLSDLGENFDGTAESAQELATATIDYYNAQVQLLYQIEQTKTAISDMLTGLSRSFELQTLEGDAKRNFLFGDYNSTLDLIAGAADPTQIANLAERAAQDLAAAFNSLTPEEQKAQLAQYQARIAELDAFVNARLNIVSEAVQADADAALTVVQTALNDFAAKIDTTADKDRQTADINLKAAQTPIKVDPVIIYIDRSAVNA